jgi:hypothetical protein
MQHVGGLVELLDSLEQVVEAVFSLYSGMLIYSPVAQVPRLLILVLLFIKDLLVRHLGGEN